MNYQPPIDPIGGTDPVTNWDAVGGRDEFIIMLSNAIDACDRLGYECKFDAFQLAAWLESPSRRERMLASHHIAQVRQTLKQAADEEARWN